MSISRHACVMSMTRMIENLPTETDLTSLEQDLKQALGCKTQKDFVLNLIRLSSNIIPLQSLNKLHRRFQDAHEKYNSVSIAHANINFHTFNILRFNYQYEHILK